LILTDTILQVAGNTESVTQKSGVKAEVAWNGFHTMEETIQGMDLI
jgi:hypothetical protein